MYIPQLSIFNKCKCNFFLLIINFQYSSNAWSPVQVQLYRHKWQGWRKNVLSFNIFMTFSQSHFYLAPFRSTCQEARRFAAIIKHRKSQRDSLLNHSLNHEERFLIPSEWNLKKDFRITNSSSSIGGNDSSGGRSSRKVKETENLILFETEKCLFIEEDLQNQAVSKVMINSMLCLYCHQLPHKSSAIFSFF